MGFGHRIYRTYDPARLLIRKLAYEVFERAGVRDSTSRSSSSESPLDDEYFASRRFYTNLGVLPVYQAVGPPAMFPVLFARENGCMARTLGGARRQFGAEDRATKQISSAAGREATRRPRTGVRPRCVRARSRGHLTRRHAASAVRQRRAIRSRRAAALARSAPLLHRTGSSRHRILTGLAASRRKPQRSMASIAF